MNPAKWWIHFGTSAKNLRNMAIRILSQTVSASGCECNWSTFALIHGKQRNRLTQKYLDNLVYVHYNLRLRLKCIREKVQLKYTDPMLDDYADEDDDPIIGWLAGQQQEPELDELGSPPRPASVVARKIRVDPRQWAEENIPHRVPADQPQPEETQGTHSSHDSLSDTSSQRFEREMYRRSFRQPARKHPSSQSQETQSQRGTRGEKKDSCTCTTFESIGAIWLRYGHQGE
uniref:Uncharacterized protein LOC109506364 n=1 Tax=Elaeis guineensis var. tenera TaxID=51953 RepID=A0A6J0PNQ3_ELAGV|nr:uncharacterized protein LOC109506364 [Elaeis guineensis]